MQIDARFVWTAIGDLGLTAAAVFEERAPAQPSVILPAAASTTESLTAMPGLTSFHSESDASWSHGQPITSFGTWHGWAAAAGATLLVASASVGAAAWYSHAQVVQGPPVAALTPPPGPDVVSQPASMPPLAEPPAPESEPAVEAEGAVSVAPTQSHGYSILVASFENRQRADRLVEELTNAGYGAHAVELDGGATHGPLTQVKVSGYTSAIDVQRDLQRIRELPGGYSDARIVERD